MMEFICNQCNNRYMKPIPTIMQNDNHYVLKYFCSKCGAEAYSEMVEDPNSDSTHERLMELAEELEINGLLADDDLNELL